MDRNETVFLSLNDHQTQNGNALRSQKSWLVWGHFGMLSVNSFVLHQKHPKTLKLHHKPCTTLGCKAAWKELQIVADSLGIPIVADQEPSVMTCVVGVWGLVSAFVKVEDFHSLARDVHICVHVCGPACATNWKPHWLANPGNQD